MKNKLIMHINYFEYLGSIELACQKAAELGFDGIEFRSKDLSGKMSDEEYFSEIRRCCDKYGIENVIFGYPGARLSSPDKSVRDEELDGYKSRLRIIAKYFKPLAVNFFTGEIFDEDKNFMKFNANGSVIADDSLRQQIADGCAEVAELAKELSINVCVETHMNYYHDHVQPTLDLMKRVNRDNFGILFDFGNMVMLKNHQKLTDAIDNCIKNIMYVHLKNSVQLNNGEIFPTAIAEGDIDHRTYLKKLKALGYEGPIALEATRSGDKEYYAKCDLAYIKNLISEI